MAAQKPAKTTEETGQEDDPSSEACRAVLLPISEDGPDARGPEAGFGYRMYRNATRRRRPRKHVVAIIGKCRSHTGPPSMAMPACVTGITAVMALWQGGESSWSSSASTSGWTRSAPACRTHLLRFACRLPAPPCVDGGAHARHLACTKASLLAAGRAVLQAHVAYAGRWRRWP